MLCTVMFTCRLFHCNCSVLLEVLLKPFICSQTPVDFSVHVFSAFECGRKVGVFEAWGKLLS